MYNIYSFGDSTLLASIFNGMAALTQSNMFQGAIAVFLMIGFIMIVYEMLVAKHGKAGVFLKYLVLSTIFITAGVYHKVTVNVQNMDGTQPQTIDNIPFMVAGTGWILSEIGYQFGLMFDQAYSSVDNTPKNLLATSGAPIGVGGKFMIAASTYNIEDSYLRQSMTTYIVDCIPAAIAHGNFSDDQIFKSNDIWKLFGTSDYAKSPALSTVYYGAKNLPTCTYQELNNPKRACKSSVGSVMSCGQAYNYITADLSNAQTDVVNTFVAQSSAGLSALLFKSVITHNATAGAYSPTAGSYLMQTAMINTMKNIPEALAMKANSPTLMQEFAITKANSSTVDSWVSQSAVFSSTFGFIFAMLQVIIYALSPLILLFGLVGKLGYGKLKNWLLLMLWMPLTFVILVIIQAIVSHMTYTDITQVINSMNGLTSQSQDFITAKSQLILKAASGMETSAPLIAAAIVWSGNYAVTAMMGHTGASTFGKTAGGESATGDQTVDGISMDNVSADQTNMSATTSIGAKPTSVDVSAGMPNIREDFGGSTAMFSGSTLNQAQQYNSQGSSTTTGSISHGMGSGGSQSQDASKQQSYDRSNQISRIHSDSLGLNSNLGSIIRGAGGMKAGIGAAEKGLEKQGIKSAEASKIVDTAVKDNEKSANTFLGEMGMDASKVSGTDKQAMGGMISDMAQAKISGNNEAYSTASKDLSSYVKDNNIGSEPESFWSKAGDFTKNWGAAVAGGVAIAGTGVAALFTGGAAAAAIPEEVAVEGAAIATAEAGGELAAGVSEAEEVSTAVEKVAEESKIVDQYGRPFSKEAEVAEDSKVAESTEDSIGKTGTSTSGVDESESKGGSLRGKLTKAGVGLGMVAADATGGGVAYKHGGSNTNIANSRSSYGNTSSTTKNYDTRTASSTDYKQTQSSSSSIKYNESFNMGAGTSADVSGIIGKQPDSARLLDQENYSKQIDNLSGDLQDAHKKLQSQLSNTQSGVKNETDSGDKGIIDASHDYVPRGRNIKDSDS